MKTSPAKFLRLSWQYGLLAAVLLILCVGLLYPIYLTVRGGFAANIVSPPELEWADVVQLFTQPSQWLQDVRTSWTLDHLKLVFKDPVLVASLFNSFKLAVCTTTLSILIALPLAVLGANYRFPGKSFFNAAILVPMILPPFVGAIGVRAMLGRQGALNALFDAHLDILGNAKFWGVVALQAFSLYPIIYLNATAALANLDPALDEAAENLGARWWRRFTRITLPLIRPGLFAGATIVFIWSFTELGTPLIFSYYEVAPVQIFNGLKEVENSATPYALTVVLLAAAIGFYILGRVVFGKKGYATSLRAARAGSEKVLSGGPALAATVLFSVITLLAVLPHLGVLLTSVTAPGQWYRSVLPTHFTLSHYQQAMTAADSFGSIVNSLKLSCVAMVIDVFLGVLVGYLIVRTEIRGRGVLDTLCMLPLAVPGLVMAFGFVAMSMSWPFGKGGPLAGMVSVIGVDPNPLPLLVMAYGIRRLPYIVRSTVAGLEQTSGELEEAAINLGASRLYAVRRVILPLIAANLIAGGLLVFSFSMLEVSDSILLAQQAKDFPITKAILVFTDRLGDGLYIASALGSWGMALLAVTLVGASLMLGKKMGAMFRV